jgi:putative hemolysin
VEKLKRIIIFTILLIMLAACTPYSHSPESSGTDVPPVNLPNPASVNCEENGNILEIRTAADGSQSGVCVFPDGSECDEWVFFRGECGPATTASPMTNAATETTIEATIAIVENGSGGYMPPGTAEEISDWWGVIKSTESGAQYDDYFERQDLGQTIIYFGIDSSNPDVKSLIEAMRDSGKIVHLFGTLFSNVPDFNGSQILVDRIEVFD